MPIEASNRDHKARAARAMATLDSTSVLKARRQRRMLRRVFERPPGRHQDIQGLLRGAEHGAKRIDGKHAAVLPLGRVHAPNMKRRHRRVPRLGVQPQRFCIEFVLVSGIPRARAAHHLPFRPRHHGTQIAPTVS